MTEQYNLFSSRSLRVFVWAVYFCLGVLRAFLIHLNLGLCLVYCLLYLANFYGLSFFVLTNRGMFEHTVVGSVFSSSVDAAVWGIAFLVVLVWLVYGWFNKSVPKFSRSSVSFYWLLGS